MNTLFDIQYKIIHHHFFQKHKEILCLINPDYDYNCYYMNKDQLKEYNELQIDAIKEYAKENKITFDAALDQWINSYHCSFFRTLYHVKKFFSLY